MAGEFTPTLNQVALLVCEQLPHLAREPIHRLDSAGTTNAVFRIGKRHVARFSMHPQEPDEERLSLQRELRAMSAFARASPVACPRPVLLGEPGYGFQMPWSVLTWLEGDIANPHDNASNTSLALDLATLIRVLRQDSTGGRVFQGAGRGGDLTNHDEWVEHCIRQSRGLLDTDAMTATWISLRALPRRDPDVMSHTDLIPGNLIVGAGRLAAVLDTGGYQPADPALDLVCAWHLFDVPARESFRLALGSDEVEWERGKAWAFQQAAGLGWYYRERNPPMADLGVTSMTRILESAR